MGMVGGVAASAVQAPMFSADSAGFFQLNSQCLTRAMQANQNIIVRDTYGFGNLRGILFLDIDSPDELGILAFHGRKQFPETIAEPVPFFIQDTEWKRLGRDVLRERIHFSCLRGSGTVVVDYRVP